MNALRRDFLPEDLRPFVQAGGITGLVAVQACSTVQETRWLLELARRHPEILGVVGWVPLVDLRVADILEPLASVPQLKAVRHVLQAEPDPEYMLRDDFSAGIATLRHFGLAYDILIYERQLPQALALVDRHPDQTFVLDHLAKPRIREGVLSPWRESIRELASRPNVYCKVSGLVTEADWTRWSVEDLRPYCEIALAAFGPRRLMFGSDWPVLNLAGDYIGWLGAFREIFGTLSRDERSWIEERTARVAYRL